MKQIRHINKIILLIFFLLFLFMIIVDRNVNPIAQNEHK